MTSSSVRHGPKTGGRYYTDDRPSPKEGTFIRQVYDLAVAGLPIERKKLTGHIIPSARGHSRLHEAFNQLKIFHGFEFEREDVGVWRATSRVHGSGQVERIYPSV